MYVDTVNRLELTRLCPLVALAPYILYTINGMSGPGLEAVRGKNSIS